MYGRDERLLLKRITYIALFGFLCIVVLFFIQGCSFLGANHSEQLSIDCKDCVVKYGKDHIITDNNLDIKSLR